MQVCIVLLHASCAHTFVVTCRNVHVRTQVLYERVVRQRSSLHFLPRLERPARHGMSLQSTLIHAFSLSSPSFRRYPSPSPSLPPSLPLTLHRYVGSISRASVGMEINVTITTSDPSTRCQIKNRMTPSELTFLSSNFAPKKSPNYFFYQSLTYFI